MRRFESGCSAARPTLFHRWSQPWKRASTGNPQLQRFSTAYADGDPAPRSTAQRGGGSNGRVRASTVIGASRSAGGIWHRYRTRSLERLQPKLRSHRALGRTAAAPGDLAEVVVPLPQPPLAQAILRDRSLAAAVTRHRRLDLRAPAAVSYLRTLASAQRTLQARLASAIPDASVRWRFDVVLDGLAVVVPRSELARLDALSGATVWPSVTYHALANTGPQLLGAPALWGSTLATAGQGLRIGVIDDGLDQTHPYFDPNGFTYPAGFPKGNTAFTTPKVIVARAFAPASERWRYATTPFDPVNCDHATHVAGF